MFFGPLAQSCRREN